VIDADNYFRSETAIRRYIHVRLTPVEKQSFMIDIGQLLTEETANGRNLIDGLAPEIR